MEESLLLEAVVQYVCDDPDPSVPNLRWTNLIKGPLVSKGRGKYRLSLMSEVPDTLTWSPGYLTQLT